MAATALDIEIIRLNIDDPNYEDFTDDKYVNYYYDQKNSIAYASWKLTEVLLVRLRKEILKKDDTGSETTEFVALKDRIDLLKETAKKYKDEYEAETGAGSGQYINTVKPVIAGGDV